MIWTHGQVEPEWCASICSRDSGSNLCDIGSRPVAPCWPAFQRRDYQARNRRV